MDKRNQIILVTGAKRHQGGVIARHLLQRGFAVRAFAHSPDKPEAEALSDAGAEVVGGDFDDRASLDRALQDAYGVFSVQDFEGGIEAEIRQGKQVADAARAAGVEHFVYSSVGSANRQTGVPHFDSK